MQFRRRHNPKATVDLVPMIDVVFQLVVFFMVSTTFDLTPGIKLNFPESATAEQVVMNQLVVSVKGENELYLNKERLNNLQELDTLLASIDEDIQEEMNSIVLEGDKTVSYDFLVQILDVLRKNGFKGVNLKTSPKD
ncbi:MAG: ExbD/TolR family protein [Spirochaetia bacterium]